MGVAEWGTPSVSIWTEISGLGMERLGGSGEVAGRLKHSQLSPLVPSKMIGPTSCLPTSLVHLHQWNQLAAHSCGRPGGWAESDRRHAILRSHPHAQLEPFFCGV